MELTTAGIILIVYIVLLVAGGLVGFLKAKSKASLITSAGFALLLVISEFVIGTRFLTATILFVLLIVFAIRFGKGRKFMPSGLLALVTLIVLLIRLFLVA